MPVLGIAVVKTVRSVPDSLHTENPAVYESDAYGYR